MTLSFSASVAFYNKSKVGKDGRNRLDAFRQPRTCRHKTTSLPHLTNNLPHSRKMQSVKCSYLLVAVLSGRFAATMLAFRVAYRLSISSSDGAGGRCCALESPSLPRGLYPCFSSALQNRHLLNRSAGLTLPDRWSDVAYHPWRGNCSMSNPPGKAAIFTPVAS